MEHDNVNEANWVSRRARNAGAKALAALGNQRAKGTVQSNAQADRLFKDFKFYLGRSRQTPTLDVLNQWATQRRIPTTMVDKAVSNLQKNTSRGTTELIDPDLQHNQAQEPATAEPETSQHAPQEPASNELENSQAVHQEPTNLDSEQTTQQEPNEEPSTPQQEPNEEPSTPQQPTVGEVRTASDGLEYKWEGAAWTHKGRIAKKAIAAELNTQVSESLLEADDSKLSMRQVRDIMYDLSGLLAQGSTGAVRPTAGQSEQPAPTQVSSTAQTQQQREAPNNIQQPLRGAQTDIDPRLLASIDTLTPEQLKELRKRIQGKIRGTI